MSKSNSPPFGSPVRDRFVSSSRSRSGSAAPNGYKASNDSKNRTFKHSPVQYSPPRRNRSPVRRDRSPVRRAEYPPKRFNRSYSRSPPRDNGRRARRSPSRSPRRQSSRSPRRPQRKYNGDRENPCPNKCIGIFGLSKRTEERDLYDIFDKYGRIDKIQLVMDKYTGQSQGFGFIYFESVSSATRAKEEVAGTNIDGRPVRIDYSITKRAHTPTPGVYLGKKSRRERPDDYDRGSGGRHDDRPRRPRSRSRSPYRRSRSGSYGAPNARRDR